MHVMNAQMHKDPSEAEPYPFRGWIWGVWISETLPVVPVAGLKA
jgi:hypothetical protein